MRKLHLIIIIGLTMLTKNGFSQKTVEHCTIRGEVINRNSKALLLHKRSESFQSFLSNPVKIPIKKGKFDFTFSYDELEAYELIFEDEFKEGGWTAITFFPTNGVVEFTLYPQDEWTKNTIIGGELNAEYAAYQSNEKKLFAKQMNELMRIQDHLIEMDEHESPEYQEVLRQLRATKSDDQEARLPIYQKMDEMNKTHARYTEKVKQLFVDPYDSLTRVILKWKYDYIKSNVSLMSYYQIWFDVDFKMKNNSLVSQLVTDVFPLFEEKYPEHIYTKLIRTQISGLHTIKAGNRYIDLKAPTINGDTIQLSKMIEGHVALIDLWGSWCGPCIAKSRLVVPIYEEYKDKGFEIVGIAREFKNTDAVKRRLSKEQFLWTNLVDLDDKLNIWNLYGISNGTGLMVLVDRDGIILSVDPKPEELEKILQQKLN